MSHGDVTGRWAMAPALPAALPVWAELGEHVLPGVSRRWEEHPDGSVSAYLDGPPELAARRRGGATPSSVDPAAGAPQSPEGHP